MERKYLSPSFEIRLANKTFIFIHSHSRCPCELASDLVKVVKWSGLATAVVAELFVVVVLVCSVKVLYQAL